MARVRVVLPDGTPGSVDESDVGNMPPGSRVLSAQENAQAQLSEEYAAQPLAKKIAGVAASTVAGPIASNALDASGAIAVQPEVAAFQSKMPTAVTLGIERPLTKAAIDTVGAPNAGQQYAQHQALLAEAHPEIQTAGEVAGFAAGAIGGSGAGLARAAPGLATTALGETAEAAVASRLGGLAAKGFLGRAAATGASLAARGAVEGGIYAGASQANQNILDDKPIGEKLYSAIGHGALTGGALGGLMGFGGSVAASGARSVFRGVAGKALELAEGGAKAEEDIGALTSKTEDVTANAAFAKPKPVSAQSVLQAPDDAARRLANQLALDALGATKTAARDALEYVEADAVGAYVNRIAIKPSGGGGGLIKGSMRAGAEGRADQLLEIIQNDKATRIGPALSDAIKSTPARFPLQKLVDEATAVHEAMLRDPTKISGADAFKNRVGLELSSLLRTPGRVDANGAIDAADAFYTRAALERGAYEVSRSSSPAGQAYKGFLRKWDATVLDTIDEAAASAGKSGAKDQIKHWKREWQLASAAEKMAEDGTERVLRNNTFGIREGIGAAAGVAAGHPIAGLLTLVGGKLARERGSAAAAYALGHLADSGMIAHYVGRLNAKVSSAAKGVLQQAPAKALPAAAAQTGAQKAAQTASNKADVIATQSKAQAVVKWLTDIRSNPDRLISQLEEAANAIRQSAGPKTSSAYTASALRAINFISAYVPIKERRDPLDPRSTPPLTFDEANRLIRATKYALKPETVYDDFGKGIITPEGLHAAHEFDMDSFDEFQQQLLNHAMNAVARGERLTRGQRLRLDKLLDSPMGPELRPATIARLQQNLMNDSPVESPPAGPSGNASPPTPPPLDMKIQQTGFDAIEARKSA